MIEEIVDVSDRDLMGVTSCFAGLTAWLGEVPDQTECLFLNLRAGRLVEGCRCGDGGVHGGLTGKEGSW